MRSRPHKSLLWVYYGSFLGPSYRPTHLETSRWLAKMGWQVTLVCSGIRPQYMKPGVSYITLKRGKTYFWGFFLHQVRIWLWVARHISQYDVVLVHPDSLITICPFFLRRVISRAPWPKFVLDIRTVIMQDYHHKGRLRRLLFKLQMGLARFFSDGQTVITGEMAAHLKIYPPKLLGVWNSGVNAQNFHGALDQRRWPQSGESVVYIYAGRVDAYRNLGNAFEAFVRAAARGCRVKLLVLGVGDRYDYLRRQYAAQQDVIQFLGFVEPGMVRDFMARAHVGVVPHPDTLKIRVSSPLKLFEYLAAGLPVLATRVVSHTNVLERTDFTFWAESGSVGAIEQAVVSSWERRRELPGLGRKALEFSTRFDWEVMAKNLASALEKAMAL